MTAKRSEQSLRDLMEEVPPYETIRADLTRLYKSSHRETAIVGAVYVEHALEKLIESHFVPLGKERFRALFRYTENAPLSTFAAKIKIGHAMGLFGPKTRTDLEVIKNVRNAFAHTQAKISFRSPAIIKECSKLHITTDKSLLKDFEVEILKFTGNGPQQTFARAVVLLWITLRAMIVETTALEKALLAKAHETGPLP